MGKLNPKFDEFFHELIIDFIGDLVHKIELSQEAPDKVTNDFLEDFHRDRIPPIHNLSNELLNSVKEKIIIRKIDINQDFLNISEKMKQKFISCCLDFFIDMCFEWGYIKRNDLEI